jgi:hypothetical protein
MMCCSCCFNLTNSFLSGETSIDVSSLRCILAITKRGVRFECCDEEDEGDVVSGLDEVNTPPLKKLKAAPGKHKILLPFNEDV